MENNKNPKIKDLINKSHEFSTDLQSLISDSKGTIQDLAKNITVQEIARTIPKTQFSINMPSFEEQNKELIKAIEDSKRKKEEYDQDVLNTLRSIERNTANLSEIINLIRKSNDKQEETYLIIIELLALAKEKDKKTIESKFRKAMNKITTFTNDANTIATLANFATLIFSILNKKGQ